MKLNRKKIELAMARKMIMRDELAEAAGLSHSTVYKAIHGQSCLPYTAGRLAGALGVDVTEIMEEESE